MANILRSALFFGKVITSDMPKVMKVSLDKHKMDERLTMYFLEKEEVYAFNKSKISCDEGDYVLVREDPETEDEKVLYNIEKLVYKRGDFIDPLSGRRCAGTEYIDDIQRITELFNYKRPYQKT